MPVPVRVGQELELTISGYGHAGEGVGRYQNFTIFLPEVIQGELVRARITEVKKNFGRGRVTAILKAAPERVVPPCGVYTTCGGCQLQHLAYPAQLEFKRQQVIDAVERLAGLSGVTVHPTLGMADPWRYRNKVQLPVGLQNQEPVIGFYERASHRIVPLQDCLLQSELANAIVVRVREIIAQHQIPVYDEVKQQGRLRHLLIREGFHSGELLLVLVTNGPSFPEGAAVARELMTHFSQIKSVVQNINFTPGNVILGRESKVLAGAAGIYEQLGGLRFKISAGSFFQVNPVQAEVLYDKAVEYAGLTGQEAVLDGYCGVGGLSLFLAQKAKRVFGIELMAEAIADAQLNASLNQLSNLEFRVGEVEQVLPELLKQGSHFDVAVVDPPRTGCKPEVLTALAASGVERIVYVSCNPATLARDLKLLQESGYQTREVQPVDLFPQTHHVECVARLDLIS